MKSLTKVLSAEPVMVANWASILRHSVVASVKFNSSEETIKQLVPESLKSGFVHECTHVADRFFLSALAFERLLVCPESLHAKIFSRIPLAAIEASTLGAIMVSRMSRIFTCLVPDWI